MVAEISAAVSATQAVSETASLNSETIRNTSLSSPSIRLLSSSLVICTTVVPLKTPNPDKPDPKHEIRNNIEIQMFKILPPQNKKQIVLI